MQHGCPCLFLLCHHPWVVICLARLWGGSGLITPHGHAVLRPLSSSEVLSQTPKGGEEVFMKTEDNSLKMQSAVGW
jgi:hypothetical protein